MSRVARLVLALYPQAWRERYADEMAALLEDDPPGARALGDLVRGAVLAHLRPLAVGTGAQRLAATVSGVLACFICFCVAGAGFAKATEDAPFQAAAHAHPLLGAARGVVAFGATAAVAALAAAAAPLALVTVREAWRRPDPALRRLAAAPALALGGFAAATGFFALYATSVNGRPGPLGWSLFVAWCVVSLAAAAVCWAAPRAILRRLAMPRAALRASVIASVAVVAGMTLVALSTAVYLFSMLIDDPSLGSLSNGPGSVTVTYVSVSAALAVMVVLTALAAVSGRRGLRALARS